MKAIFFIVILWTMDDTFTANVLHVSACPPKAVVNQTYQKLLKENEFKAWSALCTTVNFDKPNLQNREELKVEHH